MSCLDNSIIEPKMSASFVPDHKAPMVLFLDRVYGIDNQDFLLHVLEVGFLPDMRAAASLDTVGFPHLQPFIRMTALCWTWLMVLVLLHQAAFSTTEMALALNRYLCSAVLPLITKCAPLFAGSDHRAIMIDSMLHTIYRLSRGRAFTKAQRDIIEECLMALCKWVRLQIVAKCAHMKTYNSDSDSRLCLSGIYGHPCFSTFCGGLCLMYQF